MLAARRWDTKPNPDAMLVLLHGLGASAEDLAPLAEAIATRTRIGMRIVLPEAPARRVTIADGYPMQAWYDIRSLAFTEDEDVPGIRAAIQSVHALLDAETMRGIHPARIVLGGFSQGAALSLAAGLRYRASLAGIVAFSGYLPLADALASELAPEARRTPIWIGHGTEDDLVPVALAEKAAAALAALGLEVQLETFAVGHAVSDEEIAAASAFVQKVLSRPSHSPTST